MSSNGALSSGEDLNGKLRFCVFGSSSSRTSKQYKECSYDLGALIAKRGFVCVNGAGKCGCMGWLSQGCRENGGIIIGVIHEKFCVDQDEDRLIENRIVVGGDDLEERKRLLLENGDCVIILPGGVGTFDEFWDTVCGKSLNMKNLSHKPVCLINAHGYYDGFVAQMQRAYDDGLLYEPVAHYFYVAKTAMEALDWCEQKINKKRRSESTASFVDDSGGDNRLSAKRYFLKSANGLTPSSISNMKLISYFALGVFSGAVIPLALQHRARLADLAVNLLFGKKRA